MPPALLLALIKLFETSEFGYWRTYATTMKKMLGTKMATNAHCHYHHRLLRYNTNGGEQQYTAAAIRMVIMAATATVN